MRLEAITTELRPRTAWEATDLGMALVRRWFRPVYAAWFAVALPVFVLLHLVCWENWGLVPWLLWWLKPLLDRPPLYVLSHALFDAPPTRPQFWRDLFDILRRQVFPILTWRRLDTARSFALPVVLLEKLAGKAYRQRLRDLGRPGRGPAIWLTWVCLHLELALDMALLALVWMLMPDFAKPEFSDFLMISSEWGQLWVNIVGFCGISLVEPFYVAAGFTLYLNRRTWLEAWDIELGFRRLAARLAKSSVPIAASLVLLTLNLGVLLLPTAGFAASPPQPGTAQPLTPETPLPPFICQQRREREAQLAQSSSPAKRALAETLQEPELKICEQKERWYWHDEATKEPEVVPPSTNLEGEWFAKIVEYLLWISLGMITILLGWWLWRKVPLPSPRTRHRAVAPGIPPMPGRNELIVPPQAHVAEMAWQLWSTGHPRESLRVLYQASLAGLVAHYGLPLSPSTTEDDCLRVTTAHLGDTELTGFFRQLTRVWQSTAYAHRPPDDANARLLCEQWPRHFVPPGATPP